MLKLLCLLCLTCFIIQIETKSIKRKLKTYAEDDEVESWTGKWFPFPPNSKTTPSPMQQQSYEQNEHTTITDSCADNTKLIGIDFDPTDKRHSYNYLCLGNRTMYMPDLNKKALLTEQFIPPAYWPAIKCLNETISYDYSVPTFGAFRLLAPKYGTYQYLPPQRWLRSVAEGAIVMLYHPCANPKQIEILQNALKSCLYRHIITPSQLLSPERPLALIAYGKYLQMSVVDDSMVISFIKQNAKAGPLFKRQLNVNNEYYDSGLLSEAHLVTDETDVEICGYKEM